jgi:transketolase
MTPSSDIRDAFFGELLATAALQPKIVLLTVDQGAFLLERFRDAYPDRYINVGIAEQAAMDVATGLAMGGYLPVVYGIANFVTLRCLEQIAVGPAMMRFPLVIVSSGAGLTYSNDGPTHHAVNDVAAVRSIPGVQIFSPADAPSTVHAVRAALTARQPSYVRLEKGSTPLLYSDPPAPASGCCRLRDGADVLLVAAGAMTHVAMTAASQLTHDGVAAGVLDVFRLAPLDDAGVVAAIERARRVVVLEELMPAGGLFGAVAELMASTGTWRPLMRIGLPAEPTFRYGARQWLHRLHHIDADSVSRQIAAWLSATRIHAASVLE